MCAKLLNFNVIICSIFCFFKLQTINKNLSKEIFQLNETIAKITKEKDEYETKCTILANNISSLLKTAQAEIQRKDKLIKELRDE